MPLPDNCHASADAESSSASPFWRTGSGAAKSYDSKKVVGASYSHTDILRFDNL